MQHRWSFEEWGVCCSLSQNAPARTSEIWDNRDNDLLDQRRLIQPAVEIMLLWTHFKFQQVIGEHIQNYTKWRKNDKEEN